MPWQYCCHLAVRRTTSWSLSSKFPRAQRRAKKHAINWYWTVNWMRDEYKFIGFTCRRAYGRATVTLSFWSRMAIRAFDICLKFLSPSFERWRAQTALRCILSPSFGQMAFSASRTLTFYCHICRRRNRQFRNSVTYFLVEAALNEMCEKCVCARATESSPNCTLHVPYAISNVCK